MDERPIKREYQIRFIDPVTGHAATWFYYRPICDMPFNECLSVFRAMNIPCTMLKVETWADGIRRETLMKYMNIIDGRRVIT